MPYEASHTYHCELDNSTRPQSQAVGLFQEVVIIFYYELRRAAMDTILGAVLMTEKRSMPEHHHWRRKVSYNQRKNVPEAQVYRYFVDDESLIVRENR